MGNHLRHRAALAVRLAAVTAIVLLPMSVRWDAVVAAAWAQGYQLEHGKCDICWNCPGCPGYEAPRREPSPERETNPGAAGGGAGCATLPEAATAEPEPVVTQAERRAARARTAYAEGYRHYQAGDLELAAARMGDALREDPDDADIRKGYSIVITLRGDREAARGSDATAKFHYLQALRINPNNAGAVAGLERIAGRAGDRAAAERCGRNFIDTPSTYTAELVAALEQDPFAAGFANLVRLLGDVQADARRWHAAADDFRDHICGPMERERPLYDILGEAAANQCASGVAVPGLEAWCQRRRDSLTAWYDDLLARQNRRRAEAQRMQAAREDIIDRWNGGLAAARQVLDPAGLEGGFRLFATEMRRRTQLRGVGVAMTDCEAMARMLGALHRRTRNPERTATVAMAVLASEANPLIADDRVGPSLWFGGTGFRKEFAQTDVDNQVRHFVGYLGASFVSGGELAVGRTELSDVGDSEKPDKALAYYALRLAWRSRNPLSGNPWSDLETTLRDEVCVGPPTQ